VPEKFLSYWTIPKDSDGCLLLCMVQCSCWASLLSNDSVFARVVWTSIVLWKKSDRSSRPASQTTGGNGGRLAARRRVGRRSYLFKINAGKPREWTQPGEYKTDM